MNGDHFILWAESQGGFYNAIRGATREQYDAAVQGGVLRIPRPDVIPDWDTGEPAYDDHPLAFIAFGTVESNHDFRLQPQAGSRKASVA